VCHLDRHKGALFLPPRVSHSLKGIWQKENEIPQITLGKNEAGILSLSFELRDKNDNILAKMEDNWFTACPRNVHDMIVTPKTKEVKIWLAQDDVGLKLSFRRITMSELEGLLDQDRKRQQESAADREMEFLAQLPPQQREFMEKSLRDARSLAKQPPSPWWLKQLERLPPEVRESHLADDRTGFLVKRWAKDNCMMDDGLVPILDFEQMAIYFHGERIIIKDGVAEFLRYSAFFGNGKGAVNLPCGCAACSPQATT